MMRLSFRVGMPPSTNNAYKSIVVGKRACRALTTEGTRYKRKVRETAAKAARAQGWVYRAGDRLRLELAVTFGSHRRQDLSNRIKLIEDSVAEALGFDDMVIDDLHIYRTADGEPEVCVVLSHLEDCDGV